MTFTRGGSVSETLDRHTLNVVREWLLKDGVHPQSLRSFDSTFPPPPAEPPPCIWCGGQTEIRRCDSSKHPYGALWVYCGKHPNAGPLAGTAAEAIATYLLPLRRAEHRGRLAGLEEASNVAIKIQAEIHRGTYDQDVIRDNLKQEGARRVGVAIRDYRAAAEKEAP